MVVGPHDQDRVLDRDDDDQRPEDERHDAEHRFRRHLTVGARGLRRDVEGVERARADVAEDHAHAGERRPRQRTPCSLGRSRPCFRRALIRAPCLVGRLSFRPGRRPSGHITVLDNKSAPARSSGQRGLSEDDLPAAEAAPGRARGGGPQEDNVRGAPNRSPPSASSLVFAPFLPRKGNPSD